MPDFKLPEHFLEISVGIVAAITLIVMWARGRFGGQATPPATNGTTNGQSRKPTHSQQGKRLCVICPDRTTEATVKPFDIVTATGLLDLVRRFFGAPGRYEVVTVKRAEPIYCARCAVVVKRSHENKLLKVAGKLSDHYQDDAIELRRWVQGGVNDYVAEKIEKHDALQSPAVDRTKRAAVVPLQREQSS